MKITSRWQLGGFFEKRDVCDPTSLIRQPLQAQSSQRVGASRRGEHCLAQGCVAYCGLWQMVQAASDPDV